MAARWQQQEINTFTTVLSLQSIQFHDLCSNRPRSELKHKCIKCAYMWSTQCCHIRSVDSLVFLDFLSYCEWFLAQMSFKHRWKKCNFKLSEYLSLSEGLGCIKVQEDLHFPSTLIRRSSLGLLKTIACLLKIIHSENTQRDDRCFSQPNTPKYIYCGVATLSGSEQCFSNVPAWTGARAWTGHSQLQALSAKQLFGIRCEPRVSMRGSANPTD